MTSSRLVGPGRPARARHAGVRLGSLCLLTAVGLGLPQASLAQDGGGERAPNPLLTFTLSQGLGAESNPNLDPGEGEFEARSTTDLDLSFVSRTPGSSLTLSADASINLPLAGDSEAEERIDGPRLSFAYDRSVPSASFSLSGEASQTDVSVLRTLSDFIGDDGILDPDDLDDFEDFDGEGQRRNLEFDAALSVRDDAPFGVVFSTGIDVVDYVDVTSADLVDFEETTFGIALRFRLTEVAQVTAGLRSVNYDEDGDEAVTRYGLDLAGTIQRPDGQLAATLALDETDDGTRAELSFGRDIERRTLALSGRLGVTRDGSGDVQLTGSLVATRQLANGSASLAVEQSVETVEGDEEQLVTSVSGSLDRQLTPLASLSLDALFGRTEDTGNDEEVTSLELGATLNRQLTEDWNLSLGYRARQREETGEDAGRGQDLFLTIGRSFQGTF